MPVGNGRFGRRLVLGAGLRRWLVAERAHIHVHLHGAAPLKDRFRMSRSALLTELMITYCPVRA
jgi:hypothetical protein